MGLQLATIDGDGYVYPKDLSVAPLRSLLAQLSRKRGYAPNEISNASIAAKEELLKHDVDERVTADYGPNPTRTSCRCTSCYARQARAMSSL